LRADPQNLPDGLTKQKWPADTFAQIGSGDYGSAYHERGEIYDLVRDSKITGFAIVSGDRHSFWAGYAASLLPPAKFEPAAAESARLKAERSATCSVSSPRDRRPWGVKPSHNHFDVRAVTGRLGERGVAGDHRRIKRLCQSNVHGVVRRHVLAQLPRSSEKIEMSVTVEVEVDEVLDRLGSTVSRHFARPNEASEALRNFDVDQMGTMELVVSKEAGLDASAERRLQEELQERRCVDHNHADSRSSRITVAAGVFSVTRFRLWILVSISWRVGRAARRSSSARR